MDLENRTRTYFGLHVYGARGSGAFHFTGASCARRSDIPADRDVGLGGLTIAMIRVACFINPVRNATFSPGRLGLVVADS